MKKLVRNGHNRRPKKFLAVEPLERRCLLDGAAIISEFSAINDGTLQDEDGEFPDWIEIFNPGPGPANLDRWHLTDDPDQLDRWTLPGVTIPANEFLLVFASGKSRSDPVGPLHTDFQLDGDGEYLALVEPDGTTIAQEFAPRFPPQSTDVSYGVVMTGPTTTLLPAGDPVRALVPVDESLGNAWTTATFDDSAWLSGTSGVGYERQSGYEDAIGLDLLSPAIDASRRIDTNGDGTNENNSVYLRSEFDVADAADVNQLKLRARFDDGFVAHVNGQEVARANAPETVTWDSSATSEHGDVGDVMIAIAYAADHSITIYRNGEVYAPANTASQGSLQPFNASDIVGFGRRAFWAGPNLNGSINEARIYDDALSGGEVATLFAGGPTTASNPIPPAVGPNLLHQWTFNGDANDSVGPAHGTLEFGATIENARLVLDGVDDHVRTAPIGQPITTKTLVAWVSLNDLDQTGGASPLALQAPQPDKFDAIVYAERQPRQWMAGSTDWSRSVVNNEGPPETVVAGQVSGFETFDISPYIDSLVTGRNVLAIQALNINETDSDMLMLPELTAATLTPSQFDQLGYFREPTPGAINGEPFQRLFSELSFSHSRVYYDAPFDVEINSDDADVTIRYTLDGSPPSDSSAAYGGPITIAGTSVLRAAAFQDGFEPTPPVTQTFVFLEQVLTQPNAAPPGAHWDTAMDPNVVNNASQTFSVVDGLVSLPTLSISMDDADLFGTNGIYRNPEGRGDAWVRPGSVELFYPDEYTGYRVDDGFATTAGVRITGIFSRFTSLQSKHSLRLSFQERFGPSKLEFPLFEDSPITRFDNVMVINGNNQSWSGLGAASSLYLRDQVSRDLQELEPGDPHVAGSFVNVYLNGLYWGQYNLIGRPDDSFAADIYGGNKDDYDVFKGVRFGETSQAMLIKGTRDAWNEMFAIADSDLTDPANYAAIQQYVAIDQLIDYNIGIIYTGDRDGPTGIVAGQTTPKNFYGLRQRDPNGRFRFFPWDAEFTFEQLNTDVSDRVGSENPARLHARLRANPEYRLRFADRVHKWFFNDGSLTPDRVAEVFLRGAAEIDRSVVAESARWGDVKREPPYTRDVEWTAEVARVLQTIIPGRTQVVLDQFRDDGLYPSTTAPEFLVNASRQHGGQVGLGDELSMVLPEETSFIDTTLVATGASARVHIPTDDSLGTTWTEPAFVPDANWTDGATGTGVGYERGSGYESLIDTDVESQMFDVSVSAFARIGFDFDGQASFDRLLLRLRYDDAFIAYLNGVEVARSANVGNATPAAATVIGGNHEGNAFEDFDITAFSNQLVVGTNVLAIHGINQAVTSSDFLMFPELLGGVIDVSGETSPIYYTVDGSDPRVPVETISLLRVGDSVTAHVPTSNALGTSWTDPTFNDSEWLSGTSGVGYERDTGFEDVIGLDLLSPSIDPASRIDTNGDGVNENDSVFVRAEFNLDNPSEVDQLTLGMQYDDGFVAYLNGEEVARANAPGDVAWNSSATEDRGDQGEVMIAIAYAADNTITIYRNGELYASAANASQGTLQPFNADDIVGFGRRVFWAGPNLDGSINEARIYDDALSTAEVATIFAAGPTTSNNPVPPAVGPNLIHQWTFNGDANDSVGPAHGTLEFGARIENGRLVLDGVDDHARTAPIGQPITTKTLISWVSLDNLDQPGGASPLALQAPQPDKFDAVVYAERQPRQWMAGSTFFQRSVKNNGGEPETISTGQAIGIETFDISTHVGALRPGDNVLAIHALNSSATSSDMVVLPTLEASRTLGISANTFRFGQPLGLTETVTIKARSLKSGEWSALSDALFVVNPPTASSLVISEINYNPADPTSAEAATLPGVDNDDFEFVEVVNAHPTETINIGNFTFRDGIEYTFPIETLAPGEYAVVVRDVDAFTQRYGTTPRVLGEWTGALANGGEQIVVADSAGNTLLEFEYGDNDPWPKRADKAGGTLELMDANATPTDQFGKHYHWRGSTAYGGSPSEAGGGAAGIVINEVLANTDETAGQSDSIELFNPTDTLINMSGWFLSDSANDLLKYEFPANTVLGPGGYLVLDEADFNPQPEDPQPHHFALSGANGDDVWLVVPDGSGGVLSFVDDVHFGASLTSETLGRVPNGTGRLVPNGRNTWGCGNGHPRVGPLVMSELNYNPGEPADAALLIAPDLVEDDLEFVELHNPTTQSVTLTNWRLRGGVDFEFVDGTTLAAGETFVVVSFNPEDAANSVRLAAFRGHYGIDASVRIVGGWNGQLSDSGEEVRLLRPDTPPAENPELIPRVIEDAVLYDDLAPWPAAADGGGNSLERAVPTSFAGYAASWIEASATPGSVDFSGAVVGDLTGDAQVTAADIDVLFDAVHRGSNVVFNDLNNDLAVNTGDVTHLVETILATNSGDADLDGAVNGMDFNTWNTHKFQSCTGWATADFNGDGVTDGSDFNIWNSNKFSAAASAALAGRSDRPPRAPLVRPARQVDPTLIDFIAATSASIVSDPADVWAHQPLGDSLHPTQVIDRRLQFKRVNVSFKSVRRLANSTATGQHRTETIDDVFATLDFGIQAFPM